MKTITINSPKYGKFDVLVDDEDFELVSSRTWHLSKSRNTFYAITNKHKGLCLPQVKMHRLIMGVVDQSIFIDHRNGNGLHNYKLNLRECNPSQNVRNSVKKRKNATSCFKGVYLHETGKFCAEIKVNYKKKHLGLFTDDTQAAIAYNNAALKYHGEFARLNEIPCVG